MSTDNLETGPEPSMGELVQSMNCYLRRNGSTVEENSNTSTPPLDVDLQTNIDLNLSKWTSTAHRNRFSKSMGDLTNLRKQQLHRRSVIFEDDLAEHTEMIARARNRFRELELKYPEIFKNSSRSSSVSLSCTEKKWKSSDQATSHLPSVDPKSAETENQRDNNKSLCLRRRSADDKMKERKLSVPVNGARVNHFPYRQRPPPLSMAMRSQNLDDSCDSAFDEHDIDRDTSAPSHDNSPPVRSPNSSKYGRFLYPGDSLESDKDSGISTDRPFVPPTRSRRNSRPVRWADSEESSTNNGIDCPKSTSLSTGGSLSHDQDEPSTYSRTKNSSDRRGILKSAAYRNQGLKHGSLDSGDEGTACYYRRQAFMRTRGPHSLPRLCRSVPHYLHHEDTDSDAETVCSIRSEVILRPKSAREKYLSLYQLNSSRSQDSNHSITNERVYKSQSMPELTIPPSVLDHIASFSGDSLPNLDKKQYKKKNKFSRRSGLYVVNDIPVSEKPRLLSNSSKKASTFSKKKLKQSSLHITEHTKKWYDNCTAVSKPTAGQSLGRIIGISHDFGGMAYQMELNRPGNGLYGFFIQKGYKQYRRGVFISRIMDCVSAKFLAGLLSPGDEILEINGLSAQSRAISEVHDIMAHSDKLMLTVLPFLGRKDW